MFQKLRSKFAPAAAVVAAPVLALVSMSGMASATSAFDVTPITALITDYGADAVLIVGAMILVVWGLKALGVLGGRR